MSKGINDLVCDDEEYYDLQYSEASSSEPDGDLENQYYMAKELRKKDPLAALQLFQNVLNIENGEKGKWGFRALKYKIKISFKLQNYDDMLTEYQQMLTYMKRAVTLNQFEKSVSSLLDCISVSKNKEVLQCFYETTLEKLKYVNNDRLWLKTAIKLSRIYIEKKKFQKLQKILGRLNQSFETYNGEDNLQAAQLLELYAWQMEMFKTLRNNKMIKILYQKSLRIKSTKCEPSIMGNIQECRGRVYLQDGRFLKAGTKFFEAFQYYDKFGSPKRKLCFKFIDCASTLLEYEINGQPFQNTPPVSGMIAKNQIQMKKDNREVEEMLNENISNMITNPYVKKVIEDKLRYIRKNAIISLVRPVTNVRIALKRISNVLNIEVAEVQSLIVSCFRDRKLRGYINPSDKTAIIFDED